MILRSRRRPCGSRGRNGFTLIELLVVVAIIGILIGLMIPAVQRMRESMFRAQCANNLKEIGLALHNYEGANKTLPAGYVSAVDAKGNDLGPGWGWASLILPMMDQQSLFDQIQFKKPIEDAVNATPRVKGLVGYRCPSDRMPAPIWTARKYDAAGNPVADICDLAAANYIGVFGVGEPGVAGDGLFFRNSAIRTKEILDGASNTLAIGERASSLANATWVGAVTGAELFPGNSSNFVLGHTGKMANPATPSESNNFSSDHPVGVNFLFADGRVLFLTGTMSAANFQALSTRGGDDKAPTDCE